MTADELYDGAWALGVFTDVGVTDEIDRQSIICETIRQELEALAAPLRRLDDEVDPDLLGVRLDPGLRHAGLASALGALLAGCDLPLVDQCVTLRRAVTDMAACLPLKITIRDDV